MNRNRKTTCFHFYCEKSEKKIFLDVEGERGAMKRENKRRKKVNITIKFYDFYESEVFILSELVAISH